MGTPDETMTSAIAGHQANIFVMHNNGDSLSDDDLKFVQKTLGDDLILRDGEIGVTFSPANDSEEKLDTRSDDVELRGGESEVTFSSANDNKKKLQSVTILAAQDIPVSDSRPVAMLDDEAELFRRVQNINNKPEAKKNSRNLTIIASPNWHLGSSMFIPPGGGGGPGKHRFEANEKEASSKFGLNVPSVTSNPQPQNVNVFILDTVPPRETVDLWKMRADGHRLLEVLGAVEFHYADDNKIEILPAVQEPGHPEDLYSRMVPFAKDVPGSDWALNLRDEENISDHGIFIAGIIHSMVPTAKIHIIQVLNDGGAGTMRSLTQGFQVMGRLMKADPSSPAVVNLSLAFSNPQQIFIDAIDNGFDSQIKLWAEFLGIELSADQLKLLTTIFSDAGQTDQPDKIVQTEQARRKMEKDKLKTAITDQARDLFNDTVEPLELIYELAKSVTTPNTVFVAAAGNDGGKMPRYPASSPIVYGVGAVGKKAWDLTQPELKPTSYSNNPPDTQPLEGSWAFGGDYEDDGSNKEDGILSVSTVSSTGYAWWAGTSFATAVMSGFVARYVHSAHPTDAQKGIKFVQDHFSRGKVFDRNNKDRGPLINISPL